MYKSLKSKVQDTESVDKIENSGAVGRCVKGNIPIWNADYLAKDCVLVSAWMPGNFLSINLKQLPVCIEVFLVRSRKQTLLRLFPFSNSKSAITKPINWSKSCIISKTRFTTCLALIGQLHVHSHTLNTFPYQNIETAKTWYKLKFKMSNVYHIWKEKGYKVFAEKDVVWIKRAI